MLERKSFNVPRKPLAAYYIGGNFAASFRHNKQCCELLPLID